MWNWRPGTSVKVPGRPSPGTSHFDHPTQAYWRLVTLHHCTPLLGSTQSEKCCRQQHAMLLPSWLCCANGLATFSFLFFAQDRQWQCDRLDYSRFHQFTTQIPPFVGTIMAYYAQIYTYTNMHKLWTNMHKLWTNMHILCTPPSPITLQSGIICTCPCKHIPYFLCNITRTPFFLDNLHIRHTT